ncbi:MAG: hypothetical protein AB1758_30580 [Candidatus Eremiobacterota bacterium]
MLWLVLAAAVLVRGAWGEEGQRVRTLVDYRQELGLSAGQIQEIAVTLRRFQEDTTTLKLKLVAAEREVASSLDRRAHLAVIKGHLRQVEELRYQVRLLDVETSRKVESILSADQLRKWHSIQARTRPKGAP